MHQECRVQFPRRWVVVGAQTRFGVVVCLVVLVACDLHDHSEIVSAPSKRYIVALSDAAAKKYAKHCWIDFVYVLCTDPTDFVLHLPMPVLKSLAGEPASGSSPHPILRERQRPPLHFLHQYHASLRLLCVPSHFEPEPSCFQPPQLVSLHLIDFVAQLF